MTLPEGLIYRPGFLTEAEERDVLAVLAAFKLYPYVLHDTPSRRLVRSFGRPSLPAPTTPARRRRFPPSWTGSGTAAPL
jgi:hypothetical protein